MDNSYNATMMMYNNTTAAGLLEDQGEGGGEGGKRQLYDVPPSVVALLSCLYGAISLAALVRNRQLSNWLWFAKKKVLYYMLLESRL